MMKFVFMISDNTHVIVSMSVLDVEKYTINTFYKTTSTNILLTIGQTIDDSLGNVTQTYAEKSSLLIGIKK